jgi:hypothetical protein
MFREKTDLPTLMAPVNVPANFHGLILPELSVVLDQSSTSSKYAIAFAESSPIVSDFLILSRDDT